MSAFVVDIAHVDVLVGVGLEGPADGARRWSHWGPLTWYVGESGGSEYQPGEPWGDLRTLEARRRELTRETADRVGAMLIAENIASVSHRYTDAVDMMPAAFPDDYRYRPIGFRLTIAEAAKALDCFEYQSCEHPAWPESEAYTYCERLRSALLDVLPGVEDAPWEWTVEAVKARRGPDRIRGIYR